MTLEVLMPTGIARDSNKYPYARRLPDLNGKVIGEISNRLWEADRIFPAIRAALTKRYPDIRFVPFTDLPSGADAISDDETLPELILSRGIDAVIGSSAA